MTTKIYNSSLLTAVDQETQELNFISVDHHGAMKIIAPNHYRVHAGEAFTTGFFWDSASPVAAGATVQLLIVPSVGSHFNANFSTAGAFDLFYYQDVITSANGNLLLNNNKNGFSSNTSGMKIFEAPTVTDKGTQLGGSVVPSGGIFGGGGGAGSAFGSEFILNPVSNYMFEATNATAGALEIAISFEWYEPT